MKRLMLAGAEQLCFSEEELPRRQVFIRTKACGICASDHKAYSCPPSAMELPRVLGHEIAGVLECDLPALKLKKGDRVVPWPAVSCGVCQFCRSARPNICCEVKIFGYHLDGGFQAEIGFDSGVAERLKLFKIPAQLSFGEAVFAEPLACVLNALRKISFVPQKCLVIGGGLVGRLAIRTVRQHWDCRLFGDDIDKDRQALIAREASPHKGEKADLVLVAASSFSALEKAVDSLEVGGTLLLFSGMPRSSRHHYHLPHNDIHRKEQHLVGAYGCTPEDIERAVDLLAEGAIQVKDLIARQLAPEEVGGELSSKQKLPLKTMVVF